jgi:Ribonuclease G/E
VQLAEDLEALHVRWALVGGLAVSARSEPRTTADIDVAVAVSGDQEAERITFELRQRGYGEGVPPFLVHTERGRLATVLLVRRLGGREEGAEFQADLLFASSGIEQEIVQESERLEVFSGLSIPVARTGHLIAVKVLAASNTRAKDIDDARSLVRHADPTEIRRAREAAELIARRGFDRGKNVQAELERLLTDFLE